MPRLPLAFVLLMLLIPPARADDAALAKLFDQYLKEEFQRHPAYASSQGNHDYDDRLDDLSPAARAADRTVALKWRQAVEKIDADALSAAGKIDRRIWLHALNSRLELWESGLDPFEYDPREFGTYLSDSVFGLLTQSTLPKERNIANAAGRIGFVPKVVAAAMDKTDKKLLSRCPKVLTEIAIKRNLGAIAFYEKEIFALAGETPATGPLTGPCGEAVKALKEYQTFLEKDLLPRSTGEWRIGKVAFARKLTLDLDAGYTADEVLKLAEAEAERVERDMYTIARQLWAKTFPGKPLPPDDAAGRRETVKRVLDELGKDHGKPEEIVADARKTVAKIKAFIAEKKILTLPDPDRCRVIEMPEFQRGFSAAYLNPAPPLDSKANSLYAVAPPPEDWPEPRREAFLREYNRSMLQILTIHEAYPGHYVQLEYGNRHPSLIRKVLYSGVYAEGWAVYTEQMMLDQGYGGGDLSLRLHQLKFYLRAVLNAILDHKMHGTEFSDADAMKLLTERGFQTEGEAFGKVQRAKQSSCQLSTYFIGRMAFYNLRQSVQRRDGDKFDLGKFHEAVLEQGTISVKYLPELFGLRSRPTDPMKDAVKKIAVKIGEATIAGDFATLLDHSHPVVTELLGGRKKAIVYLERTTKEMKEKRVTYSKYEVGEPGDFLTDDGKMYIVVPTILEMAFPNGKVITKTYLLGISPDGGKTWTFLDGAGIDDKNVREKVMPNLPKKLALPKLDQPEVIEKK